MQLASYKQELDEKLLLVFFALYSIFLILPIMIADLSAISVIKYSSPFIFIIMVLGTRDSNLVVPSYLTPFCLLFCYGLLSAYKLSTQGVLELLFILAAFIMFMHPKVRSFKFPVVYFSLFLTLVFCLVKLPMLDLQLDFVSFIKSETSNLEGGYTFLFGIFAVYFWLTGSKTLAVLNLILLVLSMKRIVAIAVLIPILIAVMPAAIRRLALNPYVLIGANITYLVLSFSISAGYFDAIIKEYFAINIGHFTQGRTTLLQSLIPYVEQNFWMTAILGNGPGAAVNQVTESFGSYHLLHNDNLKLFFEYGFIIFFTFFALLYFHKSEKVKMMSLCLNIFFLTDNVLIYSHVLFFYFLCIHNLSRSKV